MTNLINLIESAFAFGQGRSKNAHWPSEATACPRQVVYRWRGLSESNPIDPTGWWRIKLGDSIHELCQSTLHEIEDDPERKAALAWENFHVDTEVKSGKINVDGLDYPISYRLDLLFTDNDGIQAIGEFKTVFGMAMKAIKENGPKDNALGQTLIYCKLSGIRRAYIMYVSRDNADRVLFVLDHVFEKEGEEEKEKGWSLSRMFSSGEQEVIRRFSPAIWDNAIAKFRFIEDCVKSETLPERPYLVAIKNGEIKDKFTKNKVEYKSDWHCTYCSFLSKCWGERAASYAESDNSLDFAKSGGSDKDLEQF